MLSHLPRSAFRVPRSEFVLGDVPDLQYPIPSSQYPIPKLRRTYVHIDLDHESLYRQELQH
jgi:hypothetical protein